MKKIGWTSPPSRSYGGLRERNASICARGPGLCTVIRWSSVMSHQELVTAGTLVPLPAGAPRDGRRGLHGGAGQHCYHDGARLGCCESGQEGKLRARQGGWRAAAEEGARDALESSGSRPCTRLDAPMGSSGRVPSTVYSQSV